MAVKKQTKTNEISIAIIRISEMRWNVYLLILFNGNDDRPEPGMPSAWTSCNKKI